MSAPRFSVVIPAHNEERFLGGCLESIARAAAAFPGQLETIVVLNRCTDATERIAREAGARTLVDESKCLSKIRNAGVAAARGEIILTLDADSRMSPNLVAEVDRALASGRYIGGGVRIALERYSIGLVVTLLFMAPIVAWYGISGGCFWFRKRDFDALGGFDETRLSFEDVDFALRLKARGKRLGTPFKTLWRTCIVTSCRKFDQFGDWFLLLRPGLFFEFKRGIDRELADRLWYEPKR